MNAAAEAADAQGGKWMRDTFARIVRVYRCRGYSGNVSIGGQFGIYGERIAKFIQEHEVPPPSAQRIISAALSEGSGPVKDPAMMDSLRLETEHSRMAKLLRSLISRMETRAAQWQEVPDAVDADPEIGSDGTLGVTLPIVNIGWSITVSLSVSASALVRWQTVRGEAQAEILAAKALAHGEVTEEENDEEQEESGEEGTCGKGEIGNDSDIGGGFSALKYWVMGVPAPPGAPSKDKSSAAKKRAL